MVGEQLLSDERVARAEEVCRRLHPELPEESAFLTWIVEPQIKEYRGVDVRVPAQAIFAIMSPDPRPGHEDKKMNMGQMDLEQWRQLDKHYQRMVGFRDPAISAFMRVAAVHARVLADLRELLPPDQKLAPKGLIN